MTRAWWGWPTRIAPRKPHNPPVTAPEVEDGPGVHRDHERLSAPRGPLTWICLTPSGGKSAWDTEAEALERASESAGACVYPVVIDERETA